MCMQALDLYLCSARLLMCVCYFSDQLQVFLACNPFASAPVVLRSFQDDYTWLQRQVCRDYGGACCLPPYPAPYQSQMLYST